MTVSNTVCGAFGCGEAQEHPMHNGEDKTHDFIPTTPPPGFTVAEAKAFVHNLRLKDRAARRREAREKAKNL